MLKLCRKAKEERKKMAQSSGKMAASMKAK
jgi:hypothetical protein